MVFFLLWNTHYIATSPISKSTHMNEIASKLAEAAEGFVVLPPGCVLATGFVVLVPGLVNIVKKNKKT